MTPSPARPITGKCSKCNQKHEAIVVKGLWCVPPCKKGASVETPATRRDGSHAEDALYAALDAAGYIDVMRFDDEWSDHRFKNVYVRGFPWGLYLTPRRKFQADAAFPDTHLLIEVDGIAHKIGSRQKGDVLKSQLADAAGWRVLRLLPEQVRDGTAVELVKRALVTLPVATGGA